MEPGHILIGIIVFGFVGSILFVALFFLVAQFVDECQECKTRNLRSAKYCRECGRASSGVAIGCQIEVPHAESTTQNSQHRETQQYREELSALADEPVSSRVREAVERVRRLPERDREAVISSLIQFSQDESE